MSEENQENTISGEKLTNLVEPFTDKEISIKEQNDGEQIVLERDKDGYKNVEPQEKQVKTKPENVPDDFWDAEKQEVKIDDILKSYNDEKKRNSGLRKALSKNEDNIPKDYNSYDIYDDSPIQDQQDIESLKKIAFTAGLNQKQFDKMIEGVSKHLINDELQLGAQRATDFYQAEMEKLGEKAPEIINSVREWGKSLYMQGTYSKEELDAFLELPVTAKQVSILYKLSQASGNIGNIPTNTKVFGDYSREEIDKIIASPEYDKGDPALVRKVEDYFKKVYG